MNECMSEVCMNTYFLILLESRTSFLFYLFLGQCVSKVCSNLQRVALSATVPGRSAGCGVGGGARLHHASAGGHGETRAGTLASKRLGEWIQWHRQLSHYTCSCVRFLSEKLKNRWWNKECLQMRSLCLHITLPGVQSAFMPLFLDNKLSMPGPRTANHSDHPTVD